MSALDQITGLIPITLASGIVLKVTEKALPQKNTYRNRRGVSPSRRGIAKQTRYITSKSSLGFGNFNNIGL
jgi:hypothetical protein